MLIWIIFVTYMTFWKALTTTDYLSWNMTFSLQRKPILNSFFSFSEWKVMARLIHVLETNPTIFFPIPFEGFICTRIITVQISIPAPSFFCLAGWFFVSSKQGVLVCIFLSDRQPAKSSFWVQRVSTHGTCGRKSLSAHLRLTAGSPSSITVVGRDWFLWGRQSHRRLNVLLWLVRFDLLWMYGCLTFCLLDVLSLYSHR